MQTIVLYLCVLVLIKRPELSIRTRMPIGSGQQHSGKIQKLETPSLLTHLRNHPLVLTNLYISQYLVQNLHLDLVLVHGLCFLTGPSVMPFTVLEVVRYRSPEKDRAFSVGTRDKVHDMAQGRVVSIVESQVRYVGTLRAAMAANRSSILVVDSGFQEPFSGRDDGIVDARKQISPCIVESVEVKLDCS